MYVIDPIFNRSEYFPIDLSVHNPYWTHNNITDVKEFEKFLEGKTRNTDQRVAYGGYLEQRALYRNSNRFQAGETRDIHLGLDLWAPAGTSVHALLDDRIHSFANNTDRGNYGPTLILEHERNGQRLYSLYGHLSITDLKNWQVNKLYAAGEPIAHLGTPDENGGYSPHLHLQLMHSMENFAGDYPGVASKNQLEDFKKNVLDPADFLGLS
jgi:murein DD-endopeptidase MepM/ murein hydrolase activator NlpD